MPRYARRTPGTFSKSKTKKSKFSRAAGKLQRAYRKRRRANPVPSILANARAIKALQRADHGHLQVSYEVMDMDPTFNIGRGFPLAFCLNDFSHQIGGLNNTGGSIYTPAYIGVAPNIELDVTTPAHWKKRDPGLVLGLKQEYQQWRDQNQNTLNIWPTGTAGGLTTSYLPVYAEYNFTFTRQIQGFDQADIWIRFDEISPKRIYAVTSQADKQFTMPKCLGAFQDMANRNNPKVQNTYNPSLWNVKTRWVKLPSTNGSDEKTVFWTHKMRCTFPDKEIRLNPDRSIPSPDFQTFADLCDPRQAKWLVISVSNNGVEQTDPQYLLDTQFTRTIKWRDSLGQRV